MQYLAQRIRWVVTVANVSAILHAANLLHGEESGVHVDTGCIDLEKREKIRAGLF